MSNSNQWDANSGKRQDANTKGTSSGTSNTVNRSAGAQGSQGSQGNQGQGSQSNQSSQGNQGGQSSQGSQSNQGSRTASAASSVREGVQQGTQAVRQGVQQGMQGVQQGVQEAKAQAESIADSAKGLAAQAGDKLMSSVEEQKQAGAEFVAGMAGAIRRAADQFGEIPQAKQYMQLAADQIDTVSDAFRRRDLTQLVADVQGFARRQPTAFLGVAALVGFAAVRFLKTSTGQNAGSGHAGTHDYQNRTGSSGGSTYGRYGQPGQPGQQGQGSNRQTAWSPPTGM